MYLIMPVGGLEWFMLHLDEMDIIMVDMVRMKMKRLSLHHCWHVAKDLLDGYGVGYGGGPEYGDDDDKLIGMYIHVRRVMLVFWNVFSRIVLHSLLI